MKQLPKFVLLAFDSWKVMQDMTIARQNSLEHSLQFYQTVQCIGDRAYCIALTLFVSSKYPDLHVRKYKVGDGLGHFVL